MIEARLWQERQGEGKWPRNVTLDNRTGKIYPEDLDA